MSASMCSSGKCLPAYSRYSASMVVCAVSRPVLAPSQNGLLWLGRLGVSVSPARKYVFSQKENVRHYFLNANGKRRIEASVG